jgi:hypothetical protein
MRILNKQPTSVPGEVIVLEHLERLDNDWIAIHQVPLRKRRKWDRDRKPDFILVVPCHGVLLLEIKSSTNVLYQNGAFRIGPEAADPLEQLEDSFFNLMAWHKDRFKQEWGRKLPLACTLGLTAATPDISSGPNVLITPQNHHGYQVMYSDSFVSAEQFQSSVISALSRASATWGHSADQFGVNEAREWAEARMPSAPVRSSQEAVTSQFIRTREDFTEQQQRVYYGLLRVAPKVFISGGWGTGKTFLAKHIAIRSANEGRAVCVLVKRKELQRQLQAAFASQNTGSGSVRVETIDAALRDELMRGAFDELVLDQAEDFLIDSTACDQIGMLLRTGWSPESRVKIFADFQHQGYQTGENVKELLRWMTDRGFVGVNEPPLDHNLRNGRKIAENIEKVARVRVYSDYLPEDGHIETIMVDPGPLFGMTEPLTRVPLRTWQASQALVESLKKIRSLGYEPRDVVVLTALARQSGTPGEPTATQSSPAFVERGEDWKFPLEGEVRNGNDGSPERPYAVTDFMAPLELEGLPPDWRPRDRRAVDLDANVVSWCTVEEFAGAESLVVILTDVDLAPGRVRQKRLTRGISRASERVTIILIKSVPNTEDSNESW